MNADFSPRMTRALAIAAALFAVACNDSPSAPVESASVSITPVTADVYVGDMVPLRAVVRDRGGNEISGATVTWSVSDATLAELTPNASIIALKAGTVRLSASYNGLSATYDLPIKRLTVLAVNVYLQASTLAPGDISPIGVRLDGEGGRLVTGRTVTLSSDDPSVATIDASGRLRAVSPGVTMVRATADGVAGAVRVEVTNDVALLVLSKNSGTPLPALIEVDTVQINGRSEIYETFVEGGELRLTGGSQPRYNVSVRLVAYLVSIVNGQRVLEFRGAQNEIDRGIVEYDGRGDLTLWSERTSPLSHLASPVTGGFQVNFRLPGDNRVLDLFFRREPR